MIIARAPMFINLIGDASYSEEAISSAIDKYVYVVINPTPLVDHVSARYSITESVPTAKELKNERIREALLKFGINRNIEIGSFASFPLEIGFKSYLSFTSALLCGLHSNLGEIVESKDLAREVFEVEKNVNGKGLTIQGALSAVSGGINTFSFGPKDAFEMFPLFLGFHERLKLENLINVFYIKTSTKIQTYTKNKIVLNKNISESTKIMIKEFKRALVNGDVEECAFILHRSWLLEKAIGVNKPPDVVNEVYEQSMASGALGGKYIGDASGGCLLVFGKESNFDTAIKVLSGREDVKFTKFKIGLVQSGARTIFKLK